MLAISTSAPCGAADPNRRGGSHHPARSDKVPAMKRLALIVVAATALVVTSACSSAPPPAKPGVTTTTKKTLTTTNRPLGAKASALKVETSLGTIWIDGSFAYAYPETCTANGLNSTTATAALKEKGTSPPAPNSEFTLICEP